MAWENVNFVAIIHGAWVIYASSNIYPPLNMSGFEPNRVYSIAVHETPAATAPDSPAETEKLLVDVHQERI